MNKNKKDTFILFIVAGLLSGFIYYTQMPLVRTNTGFYIFNALVMLPFLLPIMNVIVVRRERLND